MKRLYGLVVVLMVAMSCSAGDQKQKALTFLSTLYPDAKVSVVCTTVGGCFHDDWIPCTGTVVYGDEVPQVVTVQCAANDSCDSDGCFVGSVVKEQSTVIIHSHSTSTHH